MNHRTNFRLGPVQVLVLNSQVESDHAGHVNQLWAAHVAARAARQGGLLILVVEYGR